MKHIQFLGSMHSELLSFRECAATTAVTIYPFCSNLSAASAMLWSQFEFFSSTWTSNEFRSLPEKAWWCTVLCNSLSAGGVAGSISNPPSWCSSSPTIPWCQILIVNLRLHRTQQRSPKDAWAVESCGLTESSWLVSLQLRLVLNWEEFPAQFETNSFCRTKAPGRRGASRETLFFLPLWTVRSLSKQNGHNSIARRPSSLCFARLHCKTYWIRWVTFRILSFETAEESGYTQRCNLLKILFPGIQQNIFGSNHKPVRKREHMTDGVDLSGRKGGRAGNVHLEF